MQMQMLMNPQSGVFRPEMLEPMGLPKGVRVLGWGMSLERPTMIKYVLSSVCPLSALLLDPTFCPVFLFGAISPLLTIASTPVVPPIRNEAGGSVGFDALPEGRLGNNPSLSWRCTPYAV